MNTLHRNTISSNWVETEIANSLELNARQRDYLRYHARRLAICLEMIMHRIKDMKQPRILDVAPHFSTLLLRKLLPENAILNSIGWFDDKVAGASVSNHFTFDLNDIHHRDRWPVPEEHDLILAGEIIEHLFTPADRFLSFLATYLSPGGILILGTPNAACLRNRLKLAAGINPFEMINDRRDGHLREYTAWELRQAAQSAGLTVEEMRFVNYWPERGSLKVAEFFFPCFRRGLTMIATRPGSVVAHSSRGVLPKS